MKLRDKFIFLVARILSQFFLFLWGFLTIKSFFFILNFLKSFFEKIFYFDFKSFFKNFTFFSVRLLNSLLSYFRELVKNIFKILLFFFNNFFYYFYSLYNFLIFPLKIIKEKKNSLIHLFSRKIKKLYKLPFFGYYLKKLINFFIIYQVGDHWFFIFLILFFYLLISLGIFFSLELSFKFKIIYFLFSPVFLFFILRNYCRSQAYLWIIPLLVIYKKKENRGKKKINNLKFKKILIKKKLFK